MKLTLLVFSILMPILLQAQYVQDTAVRGIAQPFGVEFNPAGELFICSVGSHQIFRVDDQQLERVVGSGVKGYSGDGKAAPEAELNEPYEIRFDRSGKMYFVEMKNHVVRMVDEKGVIQTLAGTGVEGFAGDGHTGKQAQFNRPHSIALDEQDDWLYIADIGNHRIRRLHLKTNRVETFAGTGKRNMPVNGTRVTDAAMIGPRALYVQDRWLWVALREGHSVWRIDLDSRIIQHIAGTGKKGFSGDGGDPLTGTFNGPKGIVVQGTRVFVVDTENQAIRMIDIASKVLSSITGPATQAALGRPHGICVDMHGNVFVGDTENNRIIRLHPQLQE